MQENGVRATLHYIVNMLDATLRYYMVKIYIIFDVFILAVINFM